MFSLKSKVCSAAILALCLSPGLAVSEVKDPPPIEEPAAPPIQPEDEADPLASPTSSGPAPMPVVEWEKRQESERRLRPFGEDIFGDEVDPNTGTISFTHTDISLPGNNALPVALVRRRAQGRFYKPGTNAEFGDWEYVVPRMKVLTAQSNTWTGNRCSNSFATQFPNVQHRGNFYWAHEYTNGVTVEVGGSQNQLLQTPQGNQWPTGATHVTKDDWYFTCINSGTAFLGRSPDGFTYRFDRHIVHNGDPLSFANDQAMERQQNILAATEVTDPYGNWVRYDYDAAGRLTKIHSNDGRQITLSYAGAGKLVQSATANSRTWTYAYRSGTFAMPSWQSEYGDPGDGQVLSTVTQPDNRQWTFTLDGMTREPGPSHKCVAIENLNVVHPNGASLAITLSQRAHRQSLNDSVGLQSICPSAFDPNDPNPFPNPLQYSEPSSAAPIISVTSKTVSGPTIPTATWTYTYEEDKQIGEPGGDRTNWTKIQGPGVHLTYYHKWIREPSGGKQVKLETRETQSGPIVQSATSTYITEAQIGVPAASFGGTGFENKRTLKSQDIIARGSDSFTTNYAYQTSFSASNYSFGNPLTVTETSSTTPVTRTTVTSYVHKTSPWMTGLPEVVSRNNKEFERHTYNTQGDILTTKTFGSASPTSTYTYNTDGTLSSYKNGLQQQTSYSNYKRGIPQTITLRDLNTITRVVDNNGWVTSETDPRNTTIGYSYNGLGWVTSVNLPGSWADTGITYALSGNGVTQTITKGNYREVITYDNFLRPKQEQKTDLTKSISIYSGYTYDASGRTTFESWPSSTANPTAGVSRSYDALNRVTQEQETVSPYATTAYQYLSGHKIQVTDPANAITTTTYRAFGDPDKSEPMKIVDPLNATMDFLRNDYGNVTQFRQYGTQNGYPVDVQRNFWYDTRLRLCRHRAPEMGDELFIYDAVDRVLQSSRGEPAGSGCGTPSSALRTTLTYHPRGWVSNTDFPGTTPDIAKTYDANGNVLTTNRGGINWTYQYNDLDLPTSESVTLDGRTFAVGHGYNALGRLTSMTAPTSASPIDYDVDAFGRPTTVRTYSWRYADAIQYHPNGLVSSAAYKNGLFLTQTLNARQQVFDLDVSGSVLDLRYSYDARRKITSIADLAVSGQNRGFTYDLKGRLLTASGPWGSGSFKYDAADNIRQKILGSRTVNINYDSAKNRVSNVVDSINGTRTWAHDTRGNVTDNGPVALGYDTANQPTSMSVSGASATYTYDGNLKRIKTVENGVTTYSIYSKVTGNILHTYKPASNEGVIYLSGGGITVRSNTHNGGYVVTYLDAQGTPVVGTNGSSTSILWRELYTPFGEKTIDPTGNRNNQGYTGHIQDDASGLTYMQARFYDPVAGRFLSTDPIGYQDQFNLYAYVANDPINATDPTGEVLETLWDVGNVIYGVGSAGVNAWNGNWGGAAVDLGGVAVDVAATILPGVPGGAAAGIKAGREGAKAVKAAGRGASGGPRAGKNFTPAGKREIDSRNIDTYGKPTCENCETEVVPGQRSQRGVTPPGNERQRDHIHPRSKGGDGTPENGRVTCRDCNLEKSDKLPE